MEACSQDGDVSSEEEIKLTNSELRVKKVEEAMKLPMR
jgi:hypothetical protein